VAGLDEIVEAARDHMALQHFRSRRTLRQSAEDVRRRMSKRNFSTKGEAARGGACGFGAAAEARVSPWRFGRREAVAHRGWPEPGYRCASSGWCLARRAQFAEDAPVDRIEVAIGIAIS